MKIKYTGNFIEFLVWNIGLSIVTILTFGLGAFYQMYWNSKYFVEHLEVEAK